MTHRFDHLAKKLTAPLWECVRIALTDLKEWLSNHADELPHIKRKLADAESFARDALIQMAEKLMVFAAKPRESEGFARVPIPPKTKTRPPVFRLGLEAMDDPVGWIERSDTHQPEPQPVDCAALNPTYTPLEIIERRMAALEDVLNSPGSHAARMKRALYKREVESPLPILLKDEDTVLLDHIDRIMDEPAYCGTEEFARLHKLVLDSS